MAYVINDNCVACGSCISECPVEAILLAVLALASAR